MDIYPVKQHDLEPAFEVVLLGTRDGVESPVDLTTASSVNFYMKKKGVLKVSAPATVLNQTTMLGHVAYSWQSGDTSDTGDFQAEFEVIWPGVRPQTFPSKVAASDAYFTVRIWKDVGP